MNVLKANLQITIETVDTRRCSSRFRVDGRDLVTQPFRAEHRRVHVCVETQRRAEAPPLGADIGGNSASEMDLRG